MGRSYRVAIVGATGAVGKELIELLATRNFPLDEGEVCKIGMHPIAYPSLGEK